jgi:hypothetical protein
MAEVTSGRLTVIVLHDGEAAALASALRFCAVDGDPSPEEHDRLSELRDALCGDTGLCEECGLEPGDLDCGCRCECQHTCPM